MRRCYATPTDVLASLDMDAVTNFRVHALGGATAPLGMGRVFGFGVGSRLNSRGPIWNVQTLGVKGVFLGCQRAMMIFHLKN